MVRSCPESSACHTRLSNLSSSLGSMFLFLLKFSLKKKYIILFLHSYLFLSFFSRLLVLLTTGLACLVLLLRYFCFRCVFFLLYLHYQTIAWLYCINSPMGEPLNWMIQVSFLCLKVETSFWCLVISERWDFVSYICLHWQFTLVISLYVGSLSFGKARDITFFIISAVFVGYFQYKNDLIVRSCENYSLPLVILNRKT